MNGRQLRGGRFVPLGLVLLLLASCRSSSGEDDRGSALFQTRTLTIGGQTRSYRVFAPAIAGNKRVPLMVVLHGFGNSAADVAKTTGFDRVASADAFIVVYPEGLNGSWNGGFCCGAASTDGHDDVGFLDALLDRMAADYRVDRGRVYLVGVSNGGIMAYRYACERAERLKAVVSVAGATVMDECRPGRPVSLLEVHGTADPLVPFNGGPVRPRAAQAKTEVPSTTAILQRWAEANGCDPTAADKKEGPVATSTWSRCRDATTVSLVVVEGGGHTWFAPGLGPVNGAVDTTKLITDFLTRLSDD